MLLKDKLDFNMKTLNSYCLCLKYPNKTEGRGGGGYVVPEFKNTDDLYIKILLYRRDFCKIPTPKLFFASQAFLRNSRQPELNSFKTH